MKLFLALEIVLVRRNFFEVLRNESNFAKTSLFAHIAIAIWQAIHEIELAETRNRKA